MKRFHSAPRLALLPLWMVSLAAPAPTGQHPAPDELAPHPAFDGEDLSVEALPIPAPVPAFVTGRVLAPGGAPVMDAVVVSSAGGKAVTAADGSYELAVELPPGTAALRVTAAANAATDGRGLAGSVTLSAPTPWGTTSADDLHLASGASCDPSWLPTFGGQPGVTGNVQALASFDDGTGAAIYVAGGFSAVNGMLIKNVARWDGSSWSAVGEGLNNIVHALAVFDDGSGPALYAGGSYGLTGSASENRVAKWDGSSWSALGGGLDNAVRALAVFDDGSGPALYAGGMFTSAGGAPANRVAKWDGTSWSSLGAGLSHDVEALMPFDDGTGPGLYVGGSFLLAGDGVSARRIARWDGASWSALGSGTSSNVDALAVFDDGGGPALYVGGWFTTAGGLSGTRSIAKWDGSDWSRLGTGLQGGPVHALTVFNDGSGPALHAAGQFTAADDVPVQRIAKWDGTSWSALGDGLAGHGGYALAVLDSDSTPLLGPVLYVGGSLSAASGLGVNNIASWDGAGWAHLGSGLSDSVEALTVFDDGAGPGLYAGGSFYVQGGGSFGIARWDGSTWLPLGVGVSGSVRTLAVFDDGSGEALYAGGLFSKAGGVQVFRIARWDGSSWSALGTGMNGSVLALAVFDDGSGEALYAAGAFTMADGVPASRIARWDGASWSPLGSGVGGVFNASIVALTVWDDGAGAALYAAGNFFTAGDAPAERIARWDGATWAPLGSGMDYFVSALAAFEDDTGPALFASGWFSVAGGQQAYRIAKWKGSSWHAVPGLGGDAVLALTVFDGGGGPALHAGMRGLTSDSVWRLDGSIWSKLADDMNHRIRAMAGFDDGTGPALFVGGSFSVSPAGDSHLAKWADCPPQVVGVPFCFGDAAACPCGNSGGPSEGCANSSGAGAAISGTGSASVSADNLFIEAANLLPGRFALLFAGDVAVNGGAGTPFGDGLRCAGGGVVRFDVRVPDAGGAASWGPGLASQAGYAAGHTSRFQVWYRDSQQSPCGNGSNLSHGLEVAFGS